MRRWTSSLGALVLLASIVFYFKGIEAQGTWRRPNAAARNKAIGTRDALSPLLRRCFDPVGFTLMPEPGGILSEARFSNLNPPTGNDVPWHAMQRALKIACTVFARLGRYLSKKSTVSVLAAA